MYIQHLHIQLQRIKEMDTDASKQNRRPHVQFLVAPSRRAERLIWSLWCPDVCCLACLLVAPLTFQTPPPHFGNFIGSQKFQNETMFHAILSNFDFLDPPPPHIKEILENTRFGLTYVRTVKKKFSNFF